MNAHTIPQREIKKLVAGCDDFIGLCPGPKGVPEIIVSTNIKQHAWAIVGEARTNYIHALSMDSPIGTGT